MGNLKNSSADGWKLHGIMAKRFRIATSKSRYCNILTSKREITSDATGVTAPNTSGGFGQ